MMHHHAAPASRRGTALAMSLFMVTMVAMLGAGYLQVSSSLMKGQSSAVAQQHAFYLAEAGLAEAFQAVRIGRSGQIGSETEPARHGNGLIWVDVLELADGSLRLDSTGLDGRGRSTLSLVVEPVDRNLGFFADEDLVVESVLLVDGWDSDEGTYEEQSGGSGDSGDSTVEIELTDPSFQYDKLNRIAYYKGHFYRFSDLNGTTLTFDHSVKVSAVSTYLGIDSMEDRSVAGLFASDLQTGVDVVASSEVTLADIAAYFNGLDSPPDSNTAPEDPYGGESALGVTTGGGALLGSNGNVHFNLPEGQTGAVWGDVKPGPLGQVTGLDSVSVSGDMDPRSIEIELPQVELPIISQVPALRHDDLLPMLVAHGTYGYERIEVAPEAELVIRGPATVLIGELVLEPGAILTLDTRAGEVALYVTGELDLQPGSSVSTSGTEPDQTTIQVSATANEPANPAVKLEATSRFYGTIYAPESDVRIGSDFEIFGGVVARRIEVGAGARLHFDSAGFEGSPIPPIIGWRVIEVPPAARGGSDPFRLLNVDRETVQQLSVAHDLGAVEMELEYIDVNGATRTYSGSEALFDWSGVESVVSVDRTATRPKEAAPEDPPPEEPPPEPVGDIRADVEADLATLQGRDLYAALQGKTPLSTSEVMQVIDSMKMIGADTKALLAASSPLSDAPLTRMLESGSMLNSREIKDVLLMSSPLSPDLKQLVESNAGGFLSPPDKGAVLQANQ